MTSCFGYCQAFLRGVEQGNATMTVSFMKRFFTILALAAVTMTAFPKPADAFNGWYRKGFADGMVHQEQSCPAMTQIQALQQENARLKQQLAANSEMPAYSAQDEYDSMGDSDAYFNDTDTRSVASEAVNESPATGLAAFYPTDNYNY